jgi:hypothetical protein
MTTVITLGNKTWTIESLNLSQIADIESVLANHASPSVNRSLSILEIALRRDYHDDVAAFRERAASVQEATTGAAAIIELAGFQVASPASVTAQENPAATA